ncbi:MAG: protein phosphatase 2C domain-containing protein [Propionibacteriaceae bacterium]|jgi:protein phosphatase|nr:protein phosphatase 2C domain-containing protein [Propionibacteriaceae bacterium]
MGLELRVHAHSEVGLVRKDNQDSGFASPTMLLVADGMGGAAAGDLASRIAVDEFHEIDGQGRGEDMLDLLDEAARRANERLADLIDENPDLDGMGTTVCGGLFDGRDFGIVHLGDSRGYLLRGNRMLRLTHDHSWVQSLIDEGRLGEQAAFTHPHRSLLLRVLNGQPYSRPDLLLVTLKDGDRLLFCTDGLCGLVDDPVIARGLALPDPAKALAALVDSAHEAGGSDNITLVLADVVDPAHPQGPATVEETARLDEAVPVPPGHEDTVPTVPPGAKPPATLPATPTSPSSPSAADAGEDAPTLPLSSADLDTASSPTTPPGDLPDETSTRIENPWLGSVWGGLRAQIIAAEPVQATGRAAGQGFLLGAAARTTPLTLAALGSPEPGPAVTPGRGSADQAGATDAGPDESDRYTPAPAPPRHRRRVVGVVAAIVIAVAAAVGGLWLYASHQYFVGDAHGYVAIFRGFPGTVAGVSTNQEFEGSSIALADLPFARRDELQRGIQVDNADAGRALVEQLAGESAACLERRAAREAALRPTPTPAASPSPSAAAPSPSPSPAAATASTTTSARPSGTATARTSATAASTASAAPTVAASTAGPTPSVTSPSPAASTPPVFYPDDGC